MVGMNEKAVFINLKGALPLYIPKRKNFGEFEGPSPS